MLGSLIAQAQTPGTNQPSSWSIWGAFYNWVTQYFTLILAWIGDSFCYCLGMLLSWISPPLLWLKDHIPWPDLSTASGQWGEWSGQALTTIKPYLLGTNMWVPLDTVYILSLRFLTFYVFIVVIRFVRGLLPF